MNAGDLVRLKVGSPLGELLGSAACVVGRVCRTYQDDDDDGLRIAVVFGEPEEIFTSPLPAEEFELVQGKPNRTIR